MNTDENGEVVEKVPLTEEDVTNITNFSESFGPEIPETLGVALEKFKQEQSYENYRDLKLETCKWLLESEHEALTDSLWDHPKQTAKDAMFDLQFDKDVMNELGEDGKEG